MDEINAKVRGLWLLVECPHCGFPQVLRKHVRDNSVTNLLRPRYDTCEECVEGYFVELTEGDVDLQ